VAPVVRNKPYDRLPAAPVVVPTAYMTERGAAFYTTFSVGWLRKARRTGTGPAYVRVNRAIRYRRESLDAFLLERETS
jgi:hypothetical protein